MSENFDAIIVGMGSTGGILAEQLTKAGLGVLGLDKGQDYTEEDFAIKQDEIRYYQRGAIVAGVNVDPVTWRASDSDTARILPWSAGALGNDEPLYGLPSIGTGGGTLHWGAAAYRFREADFRMKSAIAERFGAEALPEGSTLADWPISYADLEPYYDRVEYEQGISGLGNTGGVTPEGGNPFEPPRSRDYPMPPVTQGPGDVPFVAATKRMGLHPFRQPLAINSQEYKGRPACVNCGFCHGYPCHVKAKSTTQVTSVPAAKATGNLDLRPLSRVLRINRGGINTEMTTAMVELNNVPREQLLAGFRGGQLIDADLEVADTTAAVLWLLSDEARLVTGLEMTVDAGESKK
jgi:gluconate 2-dehydrogenase alpha chain